MEIDHGFLHVGKWYGTTVIATDVPISPFHGGVWHSDGTSPVAATVWALKVALSHLGAAGHSLRPDDWPKSHHHDGFTCCQSLVHFIWNLQINNNDEKNCQSNETIDARN